MQKLSVRDDGAETDWRDVATVAVPARTKRRTVIAKAMEQAKLDGKAVLRVIPAEHAKPVTVEWEQPPPQLRIG